MKTCALSTAIAGVLLVAACASGPSTDRKLPNQPPTPAPSNGLVDASFDWHGLVLVPFGVLLKASPLPLHEVLVFHDGTTRAESDNKDCYSIEGTPPRFLGQQPEHYLLCFDHDHLARVDAAVRLISGEAPQVFARACAQWLKSTASTQSSGTACDGRDGNVAFSARLAQPSGDSTATVSMTLTDLPPVDAVHDASGDK